MTISFVIPVRDDAARLSRCLRSIAANEPPAARVETVVADNGSTDDSADVARRSGATVLSLPRLRVAGLRNRAAAAAAGDILAFVDADHEIGPAWVGAALDLFLDRSIGAVGSLYLSPPAGTRTQRLYGVLRGRTVGRAETLWLGSGNLAVRRKVFDSIGGFDESLETCEDVDLCQRIRAAGFRIVADERTQSTHYGDPKTLRELFLSERWRGRDNLLVSFRTRLTLRDLPSVLIPLVDVLALVTIGGALLLGPFLGVPALLIGLAATVVVAGLAAIRGLRMVISGKLHTAADLFVAFAVALTYDVARAVSLVMPAGHRRRSTVAAGGAA